MAHDPIFLICAKLHCGAKEVEDYDKWVLTAICNFSFQVWKKDIHRFPYVKVLEMEKNTEIQLLIDYT